MAEKISTTGTRPPLHRDPRATGRVFEDLREADRPVPRRTWRHARYGDPPEAVRPGASQDRTFSEEEDAAASGDARPHKH
jgi:hypothetical protein